MGIASGQAHVLGRNQKFYVATESTAGTFKRPASTDAVKTQQSSMKHEIVDEPIDDNHAYRYHTETIQDKEKNSWSWDGYLIPSGAAATEPDVGELLTAALGTDNSGGSSKWIYSVSSSQVWPTVSITRHFNQIWQECMWGAFVDKISFKLAGGTQPMVHAEGRAFGYAFTGQSTLQQAVSAGNDILPAAADYYQYGVNSVVMVDADDGKNDLGYRVSVDHATGSITAFADAGGGQVTVTSAAHGLTNGEYVIISGTTNYNGYFVVANVATDTYEITDTWVSDDGTGTWHSALTVVAADDDSAASITESQSDALYPFVPTPTYTGSPISGVLGALQADSTSILPVQSVEITLENNHDLFEDEILSQRSTDFLPGMAKVTVVISFRIRQDQTYLLANPKSFANPDLYFRAGPDTAGRRFEFDIDYGRAMFPDISIPKDGVGTATLTYSGYGNGANVPLIVTHQ